MTRNDDFIGQLEGYLDEYEGSTPLPEDVRDAIRAELPVTRQRPPWWPARRTPPMNHAMRIALASAAVVAAALIGLSIYRAQNVADPDATSAPTATPTALFNFDDNRRLKSGTYRIADSLPMPLTLTVPDGYRGTYDSQRVELLTETGDMADAALTISVVANVFEDPCHSAEGPMSPPVGESVDDLVTALTTQVGFDAGPVESVTVGGHPAKTFEVDSTVDTETAECSEGAMLPQFTTVNDGSDVTRGTEDIVEATIANSHERFWVVDVDGERILITALTFTGAGASRESVHDEITAIVDSIRFD